METEMQLELGLSIWSGGVDAAPPVGVKNRIGDTETPKNTVGDTETPKNEVGDTE